MLPFFLLLVIPLVVFSIPLSPDAAIAGPNDINLPAVAAVPVAAAGKLPTEGKTTFDGVSLATIPAAQSKDEITSQAIDRSGWSVTCDSQQTQYGGHPCSNVIDGKNDTFWHTQYAPEMDLLPHSVIVDMKKSHLIYRITIDPRQDGSPNGNIGQHSISVSTDDNLYHQVACGTYIDDSSLKITTFTPVNARYIKIVALSEAGNRGPWTSIGNLNVYNSMSSPPAANIGGQWGLTIDFPLVPVSAAIEATTGKLLVWSSYTPSTFDGSNGRRTVTSIYDPISQRVQARTVSNTGHDMFCVGLSMDFDGRCIATGGNTDMATSIYDSTSDAWISGGKLNTGRGYQAQVTVSDGRIFTIGASWSGGNGSKNAEIYDTGSNRWSGLAHAKVAPMLTDDAQGIFRADNHAWLFGWKSGFVFQAGPSAAMNWYSTTGSGSQSSAGKRGSDADSMCGNAVMYDAVAGNILTVGGSPSYQGDLALYHYSADYTDYALDSQASSNAHIISIDSPHGTPKVTRIGNMKYPRAFANGIVLPDGQVLIVGGQSTAVPFGDNASQLTPELFNPKDNSFTQMAPISMPRNYHSTGLLLLDGTVMSGGGGLCGNCSTNHFDAQIWSPPYLFTSSGSVATRPEIVNAGGKIAVGGTLRVTTGARVASFSLVRMGSTTHTMNTDQRRIPLTASSDNENNYSLKIPSDHGVAMPGYWMLFALTSNGVPSVGKIVQIIATKAS